MLRSGCSFEDKLNCLHTSINFFYINFGGLRSTFQSVEQHLSSTKLLFLTETQLSEATISSLFSAPSYFLYSHFS
ncbi:hypothetical protein E2C01_050958 [Portunus trituberculatus]|uniref:Uncharacterized protein n=1 Tax=Portunus trituberculatus TaxID=210409 RepID=A0A5B7G9P6_PORTR|nr:hypothetical protein [Portunus trituberculatus]